MLLNILLNMEGKVPGNLVFPGNSSQSMTEAWGTGNTPSVDQDTSGVRTLWNAKWLFELLSISYTMLDFAYHCILPFLVLYPYSFTYVEGILQIFHFLKNLHLIMCLQGIQHYVNNLRCWNWFWEVNCHVEIQELDYSTGRWQQRCCCLVSGGRGGTLWPAKYVTCGKLK